MADTTEHPDTVRVTDRRPVPAGVLPRGMQTWLMVALAVGMLLIMLLTGQPEPSARPTVAPAAAQATSPDRVREYQERLRLLDAHAEREAQEAALAPPPLPPAFENDGRSAPPPDPLAAERQRREYESLFVSSVVDGERSRTLASGRAASIDTSTPEGAAPSVDEVADAVIRATARANAGTTSDTSAAHGEPRATPSSAPSRVSPTTETAPISAAVPVHRILEGTVIDTLLTNRLDGGSAAPVNCLVTNPIYSHSGQHVLIPAGARVLGETKPVQAFGETRLAVAFHRLVMPDSRSYSLDQFRGLNQAGDVGLKDRVNHHYWSTFGAAAAVGLISGLAQLLSTGGIAGGDGDRTVVIAGGSADAAAQASAQVMNRFLNRLPTISIREGHRVKVYLTSDLELPTYTPSAIVRSLERGFP